MRSTEPPLDAADIAELTHAAAMSLAETEYRRLAALLESLEPSEWAAATECAPWDVRDMAGHVVGSMRAAGSPREQLRQVRAAKRRGGAIADALSALQVELLAGYEPEQVSSEMRDRIDAAVKGRRRTPLPIRRLVRISSELPASGARERWRIGYFVDVVLTRDTWMHRQDISRATARASDLTAEHDGRIVADIVRDWARRHGRPFRLVLSGPAGATYRSGTSGPELEYDAVEFCRALSGRAASVPFETEVPF